MQARLSRPWFYEEAKEVSGTAARDIGVSPPCKGKGTKQRPQRVLGIIAKVESSNSYQHHAPDEEFLDLKPQPDRLLGSQFHQRESASVQFP